MTDKEVGVNFCAISLMTCAIHAPLYFVWCALLASGVPNKYLVQIIYAVNQARPKEHLVLLPFGHRCVRAPNSSSLE